MARSSGGRWAKRLGVGLAVVVALAVVLVAAAAFLLPPILGRTAEARRARSVVQMRTVIAALDRYRIENGGRVPSTEQGLAALIREPTTPPRPQRWRGPYLQVTEVPGDGWGREYHYASADNGRDYRVWSLGADGARGGIGHDADIHSWERDTWVDG